MGLERLPVAPLVVSIVAGCSSSVELEVEREEVRTAVHTEAGPAQESGRSRTWFRLAAERMPLEPQTTEITAPPLRAEEDLAPEPSVSPTEIRYVPVVPAAPVVTSVHIGDIDIHFGDVVRVRTEPNVEKDEVRVDATDDERPPADRPQIRSAAEESTRATDPRCDRLMRKHEARVDRWERLFSR